MRAERLEVAGRPGEGGARLRARPHHRPPDRTPRDRAPARWPCSACGAINGPAAAAALRARPQRSRGASAPSCIPWWRWQHLRPDQVRRLLRRAAVGRLAPVHRSRRRQDRLLSGDAADPPDARGHRGSAFGGAQHEPSWRSWRTSALLIALSVDGLLPRRRGRHGLAARRRQVRSSTTDLASRSGRRSGPRRRAWRALQLAAGRGRSLASHATRWSSRSEADLRSSSAAPYGALEHGIFTAHQMGGCAMGEDRDPAWWTPRCATTSAQPVRGRWLGVSHLARREPQRDDLRARPPGAWIMWRRRSDDEPVAEAGTRPGPGRSHERGVVLGSGPPPE